MATGVGSETRRQGLRVCQDSPAIRRLPLTFLTYRLRDETPSGMLVAELTTTDLRKTRYQIESTGDISKPQQGYRIDTIKSDFLCKSALREVRLGSHRWLSFG